MMEENCATRIRDGSDKTSRKNVAIEEWINQSTLELKRHLKENGEWTGDPVASDSKQLRLEVEGDGSHGETGKSIINSSERETEDPSKARRLNLLKLNQQNSIGSTSDRSALTNGSSVSSVNELLDERAVDPEEVLINLGFGGKEDKHELSAKLPERFLVKESQATGIKVDEFLDGHPELKDLVTMRQNSAPITDDEGRMHISLANVFTDVTRMARVIRMFRSGIQTPTPGSPLSRQQSPFPDSPQRQSILSAANQSFLDKQGLYDNVPQSDNKFKNLAFKALRNKSVENLKDRLANADKVQSLVTKVEQFHKTPKIDNTVKEEISTNYSLSDTHIHEHSSDMTKLNGHATSASERDDTRETAPVVMEAVPEHVYSEKGDVALHMNNVSTYTNVVHTGDEEANNRTVDSVKARLSEGCLDEDKDKDISYVDWKFNKGVYCNDSDEGLNIEGSMKSIDEPLKDKDKPLKDIEGPLRSLSDSPIEEGDLSMNLGEPAAAVEMSNNDDPLKAPDDGNVPVEGSSIAPADGSFVAPVEGFLPPLGVITSPDNFKNMKEQPTVHVAMETVSNDTVCEKYASQQYLGYIDHNYNAVVDNVSNNVESCVSTQYFDPTLSSDTDQPDITIDTPEPVDNKIPLVLQPDTLVKFSKDKEVHSSKYTPVDLSKDTLVELSKHAPIDTHTKANLDTDMPVLRASHSSNKNNTNVTENNFDQAQNESITSIYSKTPEDVHSNNDIVEKDNTVNQKEGDNDIDIMDGDSKVNQIDHIDIKTSSKKSLSHRSAVNVNDHNDNCSILPVVSEDAKICSKLQTFQRVTKSPLTNGSHGDMVDMLHDQAVGKGNMKHAYNTRDMELSDIQDNVDIAGESVSKTGKQYMDKSKNNIDEWSVNNNNSQGYEAVQSLKSLAQNETGKTKFDNVWGKHAVGSSLKGDLDMRRLLFKRSATYGGRMVVPGTTEGEGSERSDILHHSKDDTTAYTDDTSSTLVEQSLDSQTHENKSTSHLPPMETNGSHFGQHRRDAPGYRGIPPFHSDGSGLVRSRTFPGGFMSYVRPLYYTAQIYNSFEDLHRNKVLNRIRSQSLNHLAVSEPSLVRSHSLDHPKSLGGYLDSEQNTNRVRSQSVKSYPGSPRVCTDIGMDMPECIRSGDASRSSMSLPVIQDDVLLSNDSVRRMQSGRSSRFGEDDIYRPLRASSVCGSGISSSVPSSVLDVSHINKLMLRTLLKSPTSQNFDDLARAHTVPADISEAAEELELMQCGIRKYRVVIQDLEAMSSQIYAQHTDLLTEDDRDLLDSLHQMRLEILSEVMKVESTIMARKKALIKGKLTGTFKSDMIQIVIQLLKEQLFHHNLLLSLQPDFAPSDSFSNFSFGSM
ncbi:unnamed protein product [Owenia fusiformis]|uniref:Uncharacterized protein n=1 Tax=Owenia fusiformis TaxID=6347 RepID=A0A8J1TTJ8_OWEFU|nr:unnamed protein product [Owenia fusiformis]